MSEEKEENIYDRIRADADEKRAARIKEKNKTDEYFDRLKRGYNPLDEINQILTGEIK